MIEREEQNIVQQILEHPEDIPWYFSQDVEWWWTGVFVPIAVAIIVAIIQKRRNKQKQ